MIFNVHSLLSPSLTNLASQEGCLCLFQLAPILRPSAPPTAMFPSSSSSSDNIQDSSDPLSKNFDSNGYYCGSNGYLLGKPSSSGTSAGEAQRSTQAQSQSPAVGVSASVLRANMESEDAGQRSPSQTFAAPVSKHVAEAGPELSRIYPKRGSTSGGDEIGLVVSNLPPTVKLYARFGCNITPTVSGLIHLWLVKQKPLC